MGDPSTPASGGGWTPPSIEHLHTLLPQYEISRLLGHGGMGAVYEGLQSNLDRKVAIKILPETLSEETEGLNFTERFKLEAKSMARMNHPGIISVYDFGQTSEGQLYYVMEFIDGMDIHQYLKQHGGKLPQESAIAIIAHVLDALGYAHERGIVHRDIKPANIMINSSGRVKVADFGLVKRLSASGEGSPDSAITVSNLAIGTPDFVAPESLETGRIVDHRADLYSVGVMFYQLLTGSVPRGNFKPPSGRIEGLDPRLDAIVSRAMEADPDDRYASAQEFRDAIDEILSSPVPEEQNTGPVNPRDAGDGPLMPGGKRLHLTSVQRKVPAPKGSTGPVKGKLPAGPVAEVNKMDPVLIAAILVIGLVVIGGAAWILNGGGKEDPTVAKVPVEGENRNKPPKTTPKNSSTPASRPDRPKAKPGGSSGAATSPRPRPKEKAGGERPGPTTVAEASTPTPPGSPKKPREAQPVEMEPKPVPPAPAVVPRAPASPPETPAAPDDPVAERLAEIDTKYHHYFEQPYQEALATLNAQFTGALKREEQAASQTGDLDLVLAFQNEARRIGNGEGAGLADAADAPPRLKELRLTWHAQAGALQAARTEKQKEAHAKRDQSLDLLQQELVKAQDIEAARRIKALRDQFSANSTGVTASTTDAKLSDLPIWLRKAREEGGKIRAWGRIDDQPVEERQLLKDFRGSDFRAVVTGIDGDELVILATSKNGGGVRMVSKKEEESWSSEHRKIVALDRQACSFFDGEQFLETNKRPASYRVIDSFDPDAPILAGEYDSFYFYRDADRQIQIRGAHARDFADFFKPLATEMTRLQPRLIQKNKSAVALLDHENRFHSWVLDPQAGEKEVVRAGSQPEELITDLALGTGNGLHGQWVALGESGSVYAEDRGGFSEPVADWSPALAIRSFPYTPSGRQFGVLALQKPDGSWRGIGPVTEINEFIDSIGPAIDLAVSLRVEGDKVVYGIVVWIEPN